jgi:hypothetical protein
MYTGPGVSAQSQDHQRGGGPGGSSIDIVVPRPGGLSSVSGDRDPDPGRVRGHRDRDCGGPGVLGGIGDLPASEEDHRRVLAVLTYLDAR